jgi:hypothetical protein
MSAGIVCERPRCGDPHQRRRHCERRRWQGDPFRLRVKLPRTAVVMAVRVAIRAVAADDRAEQRDEHERQQRAGHDTEQAQRQHLRAGRRVDDLRRQDEHRVPGRMRLVRGDIEVADAEREIDRVDVFEGAGGVRKMKREERQRHRRRDRPRRAPHRAQRAFASAKVGVRISPSFRLPVR